MVKFIGEDGYYPKWATKDGRWVHQRILTTPDWSMSRQLEAWSRPPVSYEPLVWVPKGRSLTQLFRSRHVDADRAIHELSLIPLACSRCDWKGKPPLIEPSYRHGPMNWVLRCPDCHSVVGPDFETINFEALKEFLAQRWLELGRPTIDPPAAAMTLRSIRPVVDLSDWIATWKPEPNELIYVGQQLWPSFYEFVRAMESEKSLSIRPEKPRSRPKFQVIAPSYSEPRMECIDSQDGNLIWSYVNDQEEFQWNFAPPTAFDNMVYFGSGDHMVTALTVDNGSPAWKAACPETAVTRPCIVDGFVVVGCNYGIVICFDARSGALQWTYDPEWFDDNVEQLLGANGKIFELSKGGKCIALDYVSGQLVWEADLPSASHVYSIGSVLIATIEEDFNINRLEAALHQKSPN